MVADWCNVCDCRSGHMEYSASSGGGSMPALRQRGAASKFLENRGFGWLMEVADDEEEDQRPLLYEYSVIITVIIIISYFILYVYQMSVNFLMHANILIDCEICILYTPMFGGIAEPQ